MNTSKMKMLAQLAAAFDDVNDAFQHPDNSPELQRVLDKTAVLLQSLQNDIILKSELELVESLSLPNQELENLSVEIGELTKRLGKLSERVNKVSKALGTLLSIIKAAASAGLL